MYESTRAASVESLVSATDSDSLSSFERVPGQAVPEPAVMDSTATLKLDDEVISPLPELVVHSVFFSNLIYFKVKGTIYNVSDALLPGHGFKTSVINLTAMGSSATNPLELDITESEMNSVMHVLHARQMNSPLVLTIEQWSEALYITTLWSLTAAREYIIERVETLFPNQPPIDRIALADRCEVEKWLDPAYQTLCTRPNPPSKKDGVERLGFDRLLAIFTTREACRAVPPPSQQVYCNRCCCMQDTSAYDGDTTKRVCNYRYCGTIIDVPGITPSETVAAIMVKDAEELNAKPVVLPCTEGRHAVSED